MLYPLLIKPKFSILLLLFALLSISSVASWSMSLFNETTYRALISDRRAFFPGDVLTVLVMETANAQTSADLASGQELKTALQASYNKNRHDFALGLSGKGQSKAKTGRNGKIKAALTVQIKTALPNGQYAIEGRQLIQINGEQQAILLSGLIREEDISAQNTVLSTRLAQAQIRYTGDGSVSNTQRHNYLYQILSFIGLA